MPANILLCLDTDPQPSVFDSVVAIDSGADQLLRHHNVRPEDVESLVHGAMFTRGGENLKHTAIFIGGSDMQAGEKILRAAQQTFFGSVRVSLMLDSNGSNTTAAAAVASARKHLPFGPEISATVIGTGPVGQRAVRMLAQEGVEVRVASRRVPRAEAVCHRVAQAVENARVTPHVAESGSFAHIVEGTQLLIAAGPAGVELLAASDRQQVGSLQVAIDLNAVPPHGIGGVQLTDQASEREGQICYGALGVGGLKMKTHKAAISQLFQSNDAVLDANEIYQLAKTIANLT